MADPETLDWSRHPRLRVLHEMLRGVGALIQVAGAVWFGYGVALVGGLHEDGLRSPRSWLAVVAGLATIGWGLVVAAHAAILRLLLVRAGPPATLQSP
jgi:hypothetical protein